MTRKKIITVAEVANAILGFGSKVMDAQRRDATPEEGELRFKIYQMAHRYAGGILSGSIKVVHIGPNSFLWKAKQRAERTRTRKVKK